VAPEPRHWSQANQLRRKPKQETGQPLVVVFGEFHRHTDCHAKTRQDQTSPNCNPAQRDKYLFQRCYIRVVEDFLHISYKQMTSPNRAGMSRPMQRTTDTRLAEQFCDSEDLPVVSAKSEQEGLRATQLKAVL
jgi:hypothetical protein